MDVQYDYILVVIIFLMASHFWYYF